MSLIRFVILFQKSSYFQKNCCTSIEQETGRNIMEKAEEDEGSNMTLVDKPQPNKIHNMEGED